MIRFNPYYKDLNNNNFLFYIAIVYHIVGENNVLPFISIYNKVRTNNVRPYSFDRGKVRTNTVRPYNLNLYFVHLA